MPRYPTGQPVVLDTSVIDPTTGLPVDATTASLELAKPDGTTTVYTSVTSPAVTHGGTGAYSINLGGTLPTGPYQWAWVTTGTAAGATRGPGVFHVDARLAASHVDFADVLERLELTAATLSAAKRAELQDMLVAAVSEQENLVGAVAPRTVTETITASGGRLKPSARPVLSVTSATLNGVAQVTSGWTVRHDVITPASGYLSGDYVTQLVAGRNPVPQDLVEAALLRVQASYETQRGPAGLPLADQQDAGFGSSYPLLLRAQDKERPYVLPAVA